MESVWNEAKAMKRFEMREVREAMEHARSGGQALHIFAAMPGFKDAPQVFKRSAQWGHLFDVDRVRLVQTAKRLGVRVIKIDREGTDRQHVDLCGRPLELALDECIEKATIQTRER